MDQRALISAVESVIGDPRDGLPLDVFLFVSRKQRQYTQFFSQ
jgi:hypothetical protein